MCSDLSPAGCLPYKDAMIPSKPSEHHQLSCPVVVRQPVIVVATKLDATTDRTRLEKLRDFCAARSLEFHAISSASGEGIPHLVRAMADALDRLAPPEPPAELPEDSAGGQEGSESASREAAPHSAVSPEDN